MYRKEKEKRGKEGKRSGIFCSRMICRSYLMKEPEEPNPTLHNVKRNFLSRFRPKWAETPWTRSVNESGTAQEFKADVRTSSIRVHTWQSVARLFNQTVTWKLNHCDSHKLPGDKKVLCSFTSHRPIPLNQSRERRGSPTTEHRRECSTKGANDLSNLEDVCACMSEAFLWATTDNTASVNSV